MRRSAFTLIELLLVMTIIAIIVAIAVPNVLSSRKNSNEAAAIGHLKTIANAQTMFRESDKDNDQRTDFGNLEELSNTHLIDGSLGSGRRTGYVFSTDQCTINPEFVWFAVANPTAPGQSGDRYFCTNHRGQIYYTTAFSITPDYVNGDIPAGLQLVR